MNRFLSCGQFELDLQKPIVMGILNVTPDSFSDGGLNFSSDEAIKHTLKMQQQGAAIIDVGGESTRPGAAEVSVEEELSRVIPVIEAITSRLEIPVSIDTSKAEVMKQAVDAGASMINDVMALQAAGALETVAKLDVPICLMHMQGKPRNMQANPQYSDVVADIMEFFRQRIAGCQQVGIDSSCLILDPGFGFGKTLDHNLALLARFEEFKQLGMPLLAGISRKSMIGAILNDAPVDQRLFGSLASAVMAYERGAHIIRVHDVKETVDALAIVDAVKQHQIKTD